MISADEFLKLKADVKALLENVTGVQVAHNLFTLEVSVNRESGRRKTDGVLAQIKDMLATEPYNRHRWRVHERERTSAFSIIEVHWQHPPKEGCRSGQWKQAKSSYGEYYNDGKCYASIFEVIESFGKAIPLEWDIEYEDGLLKLEAQEDETVYYIWCQKPEPANDQQ